MKTFKWGILAPGNIANNFAKGLAVIPDAVPWAVGSRDLGRARVFAEKYGFQKAYGSYDELAHDKDVDAIYVATPHPFHEEAVLTCLRQGKPVLCEKPFAAKCCAGGADDCGSPETGRVSDGSHVDPLFTRCAQNDGVGRRWRHRPCAAHHGGLWFPRRCESCQPIV